LRFNSGRQRGLASHDAGHGQRSPAAATAGDCAAGVGTPVMGTMSTGRIAAPPACTAFMLIGPLQMGDQLTDI
jgi:hypothetical protein